MPILIVVVTRECVTKQRQKCTPVEKQQCLTVYKTECKLETTEVCLSVPETNCQIQPRKITQQFCTPSQKQTCFEVCQYKNHEKLQCMCTMMQKRGPRDG